jgi:hypothetical protein
LGFSHRGFFVCPIVEDILFSNLKPIRHKFIWGIKKRNMSLQYHHIKMIRARTYHNTNSIKEQVHPHPLFGSLVCTGVCQAFWRPLYCMQI